MFSSKMYPLRLTRATGAHFTECSAANMLDTLRSQQEGFISLSFPTISASGANGAIVHYNAEPETCAPLKLNELYLVDSGAQFLYVLVAICVHSIYMNINICYSSVAISIFVVFPCISMHFCLPMSMVAFNILLCDCLLMCF